MPVSRSDSEADLDDDACTMIERSISVSGRILSRVLDDLQKMGYVSRRLEEDAPVAAL